MESDAQRVAELWKKIVILHNTTKAHILYCEGLDEKDRTFIQPRNELCNALEHIMRAKASELRLKSGEPDSAYILRNLDSALGHEYRAFFDVCDWMSVQLRRKIRLTLEPYSREAILAVVPGYYSEVRPQLERMIREIAAIREAKDIAVKDEILEEVKRYNTVIGTLQIFLEKLDDCVEGLEELRKKEAEAAAIEEARKLAEARRMKVWDMTKLFLAAILGAAGALLGRFLYDGR